MLWSILTTGKERAACLMGACCQPVPAKHRHINVIPSTCCFTFLRLSAGSLLLAISSHISHQVNNESSKKPRHLTLAPSQLQIAISVLQRLLKEEQSYHKEQEQQEARISKLENETNTTDENHEYQLKQEVCWSHCSGPCSTDHNPSAEHWRKPN
jgi:hypothetical protein